MSSTAKRLDLRFGAFACSVQGFDDPVQPVQQILRAIQHLLEESPELSDTAINFDAEAIEQLVGEVARRAELDENEVEIVPGLVIVHHGAGGDPGAAYASATAAGEAGAGGDYVNIFAPAGAAGEEAAGEEGAETPTETPSETPTGTGAGGEEEDFTDRLRRMAAGGGEYGWAEDGETREPAETETRLREPADDADDAGEDDTGDDDEPPLNLFAGGAAPEEGGEEERERERGDERGAGAHNLFAVGGDETGEEWPGAPAEDGAEEGGEEVTAAALAERAGARTVPELMVASAAWMALTQGQTSFTRRDVLDVFETIPGDHENTPEARIKGFGKAVRNGQLVATSDGIFGISRAELQRFQEFL